MRIYDLNPLWRSTVGFDRIFDLVNGPMNDSDSYPLYDIKRIGEDSYEISLALAGFAPDEITITAEQNMLTVEGRKKLITTIFIRASRCGRSVACSIWPNSSR